MTETELLAALEPIYRYGSAEKLWLAGSGALMALNNISRQGSTLNLEAGDEAYGIRLKHFVTALGDGWLRSHPLFSLYDDWRYTLLILDLPHIRYRYVEDLMYLENRQAPGDDAQKNEFLAECGLELHHAVNHGVIRNLKGATAPVVMGTGTTFTAPTLPAEGAPALPAEGEAGGGTPMSAPKRSASDVVAARR
jgi:hypothetical protein